MIITTKGILSITTPKVNHHRLPLALLGVASRKQKCFIIEIIEHLLLLFASPHPPRTSQHNFTPKLTSLSFIHFIHSMIDAFTWKCFLSAHANALSLRVGGVQSLLLLSKCVHVKLRVYRANESERRCLGKAI